MTERRDIQKKVFEYLLSVFPEKRVLTTTEVREFLGLTVDQMKQTKDALVKKGLASDYGRGLIGVNQKPKDSQDHICVFLTRKSDEFRDNELYCPVRKIFIAEKDKVTFCGKLLNVRFSDGEPEIYYKPICKNWSGKNGEAKKT